MPFFLVKLHREIEFENYYEADNEGVAEELAKLEANVHGVIVYEDAIVSQVEPATEVD